jgi:exopolysaccharide biosynthesis polyprenyl glycosylphosphotransferase
MEVAGPRLHIRPMTGLPLLQIEKPEFAGSRRMLKGLVDRSAALFGLLLLAPLLMVTWVAIRLDSRGPAFFRQIRVGKDGQEFTIWKFRSMHTDAEARLAALQERSDGNEVLFKMKDDPRVTRVGKYLRRFSIDELPQLFNVLSGTMSLVGPRPPLPAEVEQYGDDVRRRLLVRPGLTGLWQVSGRSDLSWEESVRLDLRYVENWSLGQDAQILWKTAAAVVKGSGAY